jgi:hypothetical protein
MKSKVDVLAGLNSEIELLQGMLDDGVVHSSYSVSDVLERAVASRDWFIKKYNL